MMRWEESFNDKIHVLFYSHSGDVSGAEISLLLTIANLERVDAVLVAPAGELLDRAKQGGLRTLPIRSHRARMSRNPWNLLLGLIGTVVAGLRLRTTVRREQPNFVHANSIRAGLISMISTVGTGACLVWHVRDNLPSNIVGRAIRSLAGYNVDCVFAISNAIRDNFSNTDRLRQRTTVVYNGIEVNPQDTGISLRNDLGIPKSRFIVGVIGQIAPWKRQGDAITAFSDFVRKVPDSELWVVGTPKFRGENEVYYQSLRHSCKKQGIEQVVRFLGFRSDVMNVMNSIDALLVPSENEPFGRVVIEAMLAGKPVIGTRGGGIPEIIVHGKTGFLVELGDTKSMSQYLQWVAHSADLQYTLGIGGRQRCIDQFSIESTCRGIEAVYDSIMSSSGRRISNAESHTLSTGRQ